MLGLEETNNKREVKNLGPNATEELLKLIDDSLRYSKWLESDVSVEGGGKMTIVGKALTRLQEWAKKREDSLDLVGVLGADSKGVVHPNDAWNLAIALFDLGDGEELGLEMARNGATRSKQNLSSEEEGRRLVGLVRTKFGNAVSTNDLGENVYKFSCRTAVEGVWAEVITRASRDGMEALNAKGTPLYEKVTLRFDASFLERTRPLSDMVTAKYAMLWPPFADADNTMPRKGFIEEYTDKNDPSGYYQALGVSPNTLVDKMEKVLKQAYRAMAKANHPDLGHTDAGNKEAMRKANEAYDFLSDPNKRQNYGKV